LKGIRTQSLALRLMKVMSGSAFSASYIVQTSLFFSSQLAADLFAVSHPIWKSVGTRNQGHAASLKALNTNKPSMTPIPYLGFGFN